MAKSLQTFELQVLVAMLRQRGETYSVPLVLELEKRTARRVAPAAVFIALGRLEAKGLVLSRLDAADSGRMRRYVKLTKRGVALVKAHQVEHARLWRGLAPLLKTPRT